MGLPYDPSAAPISKAFCFEFQTVAGPISKGDSVRTIGAAASLLVFTSDKAAAVGFITPRMHWAGRFSLKECNR
jgi:hypothetical protein